MIDPKKEAFGSLLFCKAAAGLFTLRGGAHLFATLERSRRGRCGATLCHVGGTFLGPQKLSTPSTQRNSSHALPRAGFIIAAAATLMSSAALAQTVQPRADSATTVTSTTTAVTATKWMTQEAAGQWRASKLIGLNVYNNENEKIGGITELIVDRSGKLDAVVVGAGGFLGLGEHDVAIPYGQISWMYLPAAHSRASSAPVTTGAANTVDRTSEGAHPSADKAYIDAASARPYPDHALINITKDQLKAAPAFAFSR